MEQNQTTMSTKKKVDMLKVRKACFILAIIAVAAFALYYVLGMALYDPTSKTVVDEASKTTTYYTYTFGKTGNIITEIIGAILMAAGLGLGISLLIQAISGLIRSKDKKYVSANVIHIVLAVALVVAAIMIFYYITYEKTDSYYSEYSEWTEKEIVSGWDRYSRVICALASVIGVAGVLSIFANRGDMYKSINKATLVYAAAAIVIFVVYLAMILVAKKSLNLDPEYEPTEKEIKLWTYSWARGWMSATVLATLGGATMLVLMGSLAIYLVNNIKTINVKHLVLICVAIVGILVLFALFVNQIKYPYPLKWNPSESQEEKYEKAMKAFSEHFVEDWKNHCIYGGLMTGFTTFAGVGSILCMKKQPKAVA